ncbi:MAG: hypothetical protein H0X51_10025 [Parachlamydiaceae bacterium]|nr:hypothetical protein [Parachlamydiaceae bacterium]
MSTAPISSLPTLLSFPSSLSLHTPTCYTALNVHGFAINGRTALQESEPKSKHASERLESKKEKAKAALAKAREMDLEQQTPLVIPDDFGKMSKQDLQGFDQHILDAELFVSTQIQEEGASPKDLKPEHLERCTLLHPRQAPLNPIIKTAEQQQLEAQLPIAILTQCKVSFEAQLRGLSLIPFTGTEYEESFVDAFWRYVRTVNTPQMAGSEAVELERRWRTDFIEALRKEAKAYAGALWDKYNLRTVPKADQLMLFEFQQKGINLVDSKTRLKNQRKTINDFWNGELEFSDQNEQINRKKELKPFLIKFSRFCTDWERFLEEADKKFNEREQQFWSASANAPYRQRFLALQNEFFKAQVNEVLPTIQNWLSEYSDYAQTRFEKLIKVHLTSIRALEDFSRIMTKECSIKLNATFKKIVTSATRYVAAEPLYRKRMGGHSEHERNACKAKIQSLLPKFIGIVGSQRSKVFELQEAHVVPQPKVLSWSTHPQKPAEATREREVLLAAVRPQFREKISVDAATLTSQQVMEKFRARAFRLWKEYKELSNPSEQRKQQLADEALYLIRELCLSGASETIHIAGLFNEVDHATDGEVNDLRSGLFALQDRGDKPLTFETARTTHAQYLQHVDSIVTTNVEGFTGKEVSQLPLEDLLRYHATLSQREALSRFSQKNPRTPFLAGSDLVSVH